MYSWRTHRRARRRPNPATPCLGRTSHRWSCAVRSDSVRSGDLRRSSELLGGLHCTICRRPPRACWHLFRRTRRRCKAQGARPAPLRAQRRSRIPGWASLEKVSQTVQSPHRAAVSWCGVKLSSLTCGALVFWRGLHESFDVWRSFLLGGRSLVASERGAGDGSSKPLVSLAPIDPVTLR